MMRYVLPAVALLLGLFWLGLVSRWLLLIPALLALLAVLYPRWAERKRLDAIIASGDVRALLRAWKGTAATVAYPETSIPLMIATAYAAFGWVDEARKARAHLVEGPAFTASKDQVEFVDVLLEIYDGDREEALRRAELLASYESSSAAPKPTPRAKTIHRGLLAIARAFAHRATEDDRRVLAAARPPLPILAWPLRYAEAVAALDAGSPARAEELLRAAPAWPENSVFRTFHRELLSVARANGA